MFWLVILGNPRTIARLVVAVVVLALNRQSGQVTIVESPFFKIFELTPLFTDSYASSPIVFILRISASTPKVAPSQKQLWR
jgi:hypothetical protein